MDKYEELRVKNTNADNYALDTEAIIAKLKEWDAKYGINLSGITSDTVDVYFKTLPDDLSALAQEIYEFCPDTIDQHFGCFKDMIEDTEEMGATVSAEILELVQGLDLEEDDYGLEILQRSLQKYKVVGLWWD